MTSINWGIELWDRLNDVLAYSNEGVEKLEELYKLCEGYRKINADHAKYLRKLLKSYINDNSSSTLASSDNLNNSASERTSQKANTILNQLFTTSTYARAHRLVLTAFEEEAVQCAQMANCIETQITEPLAREVDRLKRQWKLHREQLIKKRQDLSQHQDQFNQVTRRYCHAHKDWIKSVDQLAKADNNQSLSANDVDKYRRVKDAKREVFHSYQGDYASALQQYNRHQWDFYVNYLSEWSMTQVAIHESRYDLVKARLLELGQLIQRTHGSLADKQTSCLREAQEVLDGVADAEKFVEALRTDRMIPCDVPFLNLDENASSNNVPKNGSFLLNAAQISGGSQPSLTTSIATVSDSTSPAEILDTSLSQKETSAPERTARQSDSRGKGAKARRSSLGRLGHGMRKRLGHMGASLVGGVQSHFETSSSCESSRPRAATQITAPNETATLAASSVGGEEATGDVDGNTSIGHHRDSLTSSNSSSSNTANSFESPRNSNGVATSANMVRQKMSSASTSIRESSVKLALKMKNKRTGVSLLNPELKEFSSPLGLSADARQRYIENIDKEMERTEKLAAGAEKNQKTYTEGSQPYIHAAQTVRMYQSKLQSLIVLKKRHEELAEHGRQILKTEMIPCCPKPLSVSDLPSLKKEDSAELSSDSDSSNSFSSSDDEEEHHSKERLDKRTTSESDSNDILRDQVIVEELSSDVDGTLTNKEKHKDAPAAASGLPAVTCVALADYTPDETIPHGLAIRVKDEFVVLQSDTGSGWTYVTTPDGSLKGIVPTSYIYIPTCTKNNSLSAAFTSSSSTFVTARPVEEVLQYNA